MKKEETLEEKDRELRLVQESSLDESLERKHGNKFTWEVWLEGKVGIFIKTQEK